MRRSAPVWILAVGLFATGCMSGSGVAARLPAPSGPSGDVVVVGDERDEGDEREAPRAGQKVRGKEKEKVKENQTAKGGAHAPRGLKVPPGHYPPPGECRIWYPGRPPGQQPPAAKCDRLGRVPEGAFVLYNGRAWDADYDWRDHERRNRGTVPGVILDVIRGRGR